ncbi:DUF445 family protein [Xylanibacillus composti]|uniref:UPF0754 membrane protein n=1 Tax=Xylanibacillus composti TaxID=1572762 RepID=A0A8J4H2W5_9BACL|nr:DUF445 family protein [Xylanibacillus composti]MDT9724778.1 DUF445 family protein [Xylanibacillus composti]GIQ69869.1 UPF0754 membrane protein [Xylanibacillus composti]
MHTFALIAMSVGIAALIGGITNHLAIKMLFHPRNAVYIAGRKLPFTPGIIPKRKDEIAESLGQVVGDYLVTSEGLAGLLRQPEFQSRIENRLRAVLQELAREDRSLKEWLTDKLGEEEAERVSEQVEAGLVHGTDRLMQWLVEEKGVLQRPLEAWLPGDAESRKEEWSRRLADLLVKELSRQLLSPSGAHLIRSLADKLMDQAGGVLGMLAGIFMDPDRMVQKVQPVVLETLHSPEVRSALAEFIRQQWDRIEKKTPEEAIRYFAEGEPADVLRGWVRKRVPWRRWVDEAASRPISSWAAPIMPKLEEKLPRAVERGMDVAASQMDKIVRALDLPALVGQQVKHFPVEQLEQIVLAVSGKEFRAITWLGAVLGGMIGLLQAVLFTVMR